MMTVAADEAPAAFIEAEAELRGAGLRLQMIREGIPREIAAIQCLTLHLAAISSGRSPEGAVFVPRKTVGQRLNVEMFPPKPRDDNRALVGNAIAIVVARKEQIR